MSGYDLTKKPRSYQGSTQTRIAKLEAEVERLKRDLDLARDRMAAMTDPTNEQLAVADALDRAAEVAETYEHYEPVPHVYEIRDGIAAAIRKLKEET